MRAGLRRRVCDGINDKGDVKGHPLSNGLTGVGQDLGLATEVSKGLGSPVPLGEAAERIYVEAVKREGELARKDFSSVYEYLCSK
jgi:hypothetical protein